MRRKGRPETPGWFRRNAYLLAGASLWSVVVGVSLGESLRLEQQGVMDRCLAEARTVYQVLTLINPELMTRGGHFLGESGDGPRGHITSLDSVSPKNQPDAWEKKALHRLAAGAAETSEVTYIDRRLYLRLMRPLIIDQGCLQCHTGQGYKVGEVRGGISVDVPVVPRLDALRPHLRATVAGYGVIWLIGLGAVALAALTIQRRDRERAGREAEFRDLFDSAPVAYHEIDRDGAIRRANRAEFALLGYTAGETLGRPIWEFVAEAEREASREAIRRKLAGVEPLAPFQRRYIRRDGGELLLEIHETLVRNAAGKATGLRSALLDITERQQAEDVLREAAVQWQATFDAVNDAVCLLDADHRILSCNRAMAALTGGVPADLIGRYCWEALHGTSEPIPGCPLARMRTSHRRERLELQLGDRWFLVTADPILDERQALQGAVHVISDITERKRMEEALRKLNRALRAISECNRVMIRATDETELLSKTCQIVVEAGGYRMAWVGYAEQDEARSVRPVAQAGFDEGYLENLRITWADTGRGRGPTGTAIRSGQPCTASSILTDPSFAPWRADALQRGYASAMALPLIAGGKTLGALTVYSDVSDAFDRDEAEMLTELADDLAFGVTALRTRAEHELAAGALRESEARYRELFENSPVGIYRTTPDGKVLFANPALLRMLGYSSFAELADCNVEEIGYGAGHGRAEFKRIIEQHGEIRDFEAAWARRDGTFVHVRDNAKAIRDANGTTVYYDGMVEDITEYKQSEVERAKSEERFHQAQKLESVGRLAGGVAHDFNNLLTVINGYSQLLLSKLSPDDLLRANLEQIHKAGERAAKLTRQLLAYSRKQVLQLRVLDLNRVVVELGPMLAHLVSENVNLRVELNAGSGVVRADAQQLEQAIMNLVLNARDAMPDGGKLLIETACVEFDESYARSHPEALPGGYVMLAVSDSGTGMDEETRRHIFEPFFTTKGVGRGTGLGLSMVQGIVSQSGGWIEVYSEPGHGTTFKIYLPRVKETVADTRMPETAPAPGGTETVLVVEDQAEIREYVATVLESYGYRVIRAENAGEALSLYERERMDLLLTDVVMPNISGRELANRLGELKPGIKVLFMSGYTDNVIVHHGILAEGAHLIQKPFTPEQLAVKVREVLGPPKRLGRILVADDEAGVRSFLRAALEQDGYEVTEAADGKQALKQVRAERVDLVITDIIMPEQEGIETIRVLRKEAPGIGIIAISGAFEGLYLDVAEKLGADAVLAKPVSAQLLLARVAEVLTSRR